MVTGVKPDLAALPVLPMGERKSWDDVHAMLSAAREQSAVAVTDHGLPVLLRFAEVDSVLRSRDFAFGDLIAVMGQFSGPFYDWWHSTVSAFEGPAHSRLRRLLIAAFTPKRVEEMRPRIRALVEDVLRSRLDSGHIDGLDFAHALPMRVMAGLLGVPDEDHDIFERLTVTLARGFDPATAQNPDAVAAVDGALKELLDYSREIVRSRRVHPRDDLISTLVEERDGKDRLTDDELVAHIVFMLFAGHDTSKSALQMATMLMARYPDQADLVRRNPTLAGPAVDECMRFESPVFMTTRRPSRDVEIAGIPFAEGTSVGVVLISAARDPRGMPTADTFDIARTDRRFIPFGSGVHFCLGVNLAKAELEEAVRGLTTMTREISLARQPVTVPFHLVRSFVELPLEVTPA